jgi:hypothetical protein
MGSVDGVELPKEGYAEKISNGLNSVKAMKS